jgi:hypothetical protein
LPATGGIAYEVLFRYDPTFARRIGEGGRLRAAADDDIDPIAACKAGTVAVSIYTFLYSWDDFLFALMIMQKEELKTLRSDWRRASWPVCG